MGRATRLTMAALVALGLGAGCLGEAPDADDGPSLAVEVAALNLGGVGDAVFDLEVVNGKVGTPDVVWRQRVTSARYGDSRGSVSYVGPCDASDGVDDNEVRLWVVGLYAAPVAAPGGFGEPPPQGALAFENPTPHDPVGGAWAAPLARAATCRADADVPVRFDIALMRPAQQGFFDVAVNFNDVFCSAKFDCCVEDDGTCLRDITLLFDGDGVRSTTMVLGFACTGGTGPGVDTQLYLDALALDCTDPAAGFSADVTINPAAGPGNLCTQAGDPATCAGVAGANLGTWLYQVATYRGVEALPSGAVAGNKAYWNVALGVNQPAIASCRLRTRATATDGAAPGGPVGGVVPAGMVYPTIVWDVDLGACKAEPLTFGDPGAMVRTTYTGTDDGATAFAFGYGPNLPAGPANPPPPAGACAGDEDLYYALASSLRRVSGADGTETVLYQPTPDPSAIAFAPDGATYYVGYGWASTSAHPEMVARRFRVFEYDVATAAETEIANLDALSGGRQRSAQGMVVTDTTLYVLSAGGSSSGSSEQHLYAFDRATYARTSVRVWVGFQSPSNLTAHPDGRLMWMDGADVVRREPDGTEVVLPVTLADNNTSTQSFVVGPDGTIYLAEERRGEGPFGDRSSAIVAAHPTTWERTLLLDTIAGETFRVGHMTVDCEGDLWLHISETASGGDHIYELTPGGSPELRRSNDATPNLSFGVFEFAP